MKMTQMEMFEETLEKKIYRLEKWINRLQKEMWWLKSVYELKQQRKTPQEKREEQLDIFAS